MNLSFNSNRSTLTDAQKDNLKDSVNHNVTVVLGWFLRALVAGIQAMIKALVDAIQMFIRF